jgi:hypothetical protein
MVDLSEENVEWYEIHYPKGSFSWVLDLLLTNFRQAQTLTPVDYAAIAANKLDKDIRDEMV